jgi:GT2 family glycosyltransferase
VAEQAASRNNPSAITAVVVTYGDRWQYLAVLLRRLEEVPLAHDVVVIDNASKRDIAAACADAGFTKVHVRRMERNLGSAGGYKAGIEVALTFSNDYLILFDDDVVPEQDCLQRLIHHFTNLVKERSPAELALMAYRESQHGRCLVQNSPLLLSDHHFLGLNLFNFVQRHFYKTACKKTFTLSPDIASQNRGVAYGGLFFHRSLISKIGLPNSDFVVYFDDVEFTCRLLKNGGEIWLDIDSRCDDICNNYSISVLKIPFIGYLFADNDAKVYYMIRNRVYFDRYSLGVKSVFVFFNMSIFITVLLIIGCLALRFSRIKVVLQAIRDGYKGTLGMHPDFPLT